MNNAWQTRAGKRDGLYYRRYPYALTPNTVELIPTLGALFPRGGPIQDPVLYYRRSVPLSSEYKTVKAIYKTVKTTFWPYWTVKATFWPYKTVKATFWHL